MDADEGVACGAGGGAKNGCDDDRLDGTGDWLWTGGEYNLGLSGCSARIGTGERMGGVDEDVVNEDPGRTDAAVAFPCDAILSSDIGGGGFRDMGENLTLDSDI